MGRGAAGDGFYDLLSGHLEAQYGLDVTAHALRFGGNHAPLLDWFERRPSEEAVEVNTHSSSPRHNHNPS